MSHETTRSPVTSVKTIRKVYQSCSHGKKERKKKFRRVDFRQDDEPHTRPSSLIDDA